MITRQLPLTGLELKERGIASVSRPTPQFGDPRLPERFWAKVRILDNGCWEWTGAGNSGGYGHMLVDGRMRYVHRLIYQRCIGPIPEGLTIDHLCRTRPCVNLQHLEVVTGRENTQRGSKAQQTHCIHGHEFDEANTYIASNGTRHCRACFRRWRSESRQRAKAAAPSTWVDDARLVAEAMCHLLGWVTAETLHAEMDDPPPGPSHWGAIFKDKRFRPTGGRIRSTRPEAHGREIRVWRLA